MTTTESRVVRRATLRLGVLAAVLLVAGLLPWVTGGPGATRAIAVPFLLLGIGVLVVALRVRSALPRAAAAAYPAPLVERGCDGCACGAGAGGCGSPAEPDSGYGSARDDTEEDRTGRRAG